MIHKFIQPSTHLRSFVKEYLILHFHFNKNETVPIKPFPARPKQCILFYPKGYVVESKSTTGKTKRLSRSVINGQQTGRVNFQLSNEYLMIEIAFQPGALSKFLRMPMNEFVDENIDAESILNPDIHRVSERLENTQRYDEMIRIVEEFLWKRIVHLKHRETPLDKVLQIVTQRPCEFSIEQLSDFACLSFSQFDRRFAQQVGISPKLFSRIARFNKAYTSKDLKPDLDWLSIALENNYHDYQHLVKDFKQFSGTTPNSLIEAQAKAPERILRIG